MRSKKLRITKKNKPIFIFLRKKFLIMEEKELSFEDKNIKELLSEGKINTRLYDVLEDANINTLSELIKYYQENLTFIRIRNVGRNSNNDLIALVNEYSNFFPEIKMTSLFDGVENNEQIKKNSELKEISIFRLLKEGKIDVRTYNVLNSEKIYNVLDIIEYYLKHKKFDNIKKAGRRINENLMKVVNQNRNKKLIGQSFYNEPIFEKVRKNKIGVTPKLKVEDIKEYEQLSTRTKNVIKNESIETITKFLEHYANHRNFLTFENCGPKSNIELINLAQQLIKEIKDQEDAFKYYTDDYLKFQSIVKNILNVHILSNEKIKKQYAEKNMELFYFIKYCSLEYLGKRNHDIYMMWYGYNKGKKRPTLQKIGDSLNLTRERVRQIVTSKNEKFDNLLIKFFNENRENNTAFKRYIDLNKEIIIIDNDFAENINKAEDCKFDKSFIGFIITQVGNGEYFHFCINDNTAKNNEYLIKKNMEGVLNWKELFKKLSIKIKTLRTVKIDAEVIVRQNATDCNDELIQKLIKIIEVIVGEEYDLPYDENLRMFYYAR